MKPTRKTAITNVTATASARGAQGQGAKPVRKAATPAQASKATYVRKPAAKSAK